jgi:hypothetical protein
VPYLELDHAEFTIQVLKLQNLPYEKVTITVGHLCVCDMDHFMVNVEIQLQQLTHEMSNLCIILISLLRRNARTLQGEHHVLCNNRALESDGSI